MSVSDRVRRVGYVTWATGATLVVLLRELVGDTDTLGAPSITDRRLHDSDLIGEYNYRTGRLDAGNDPYGWYDEY